MAKKYTVNLTKEEVEKLRSLIRCGKSKARSITRAHILLMAWEGETDKAIADRLRVSISTVERTRAKYVNSGIDGTLNDREHPPKPRKLDGLKEAFLIATACSEPPDGRTRWTLRLLADRIVSLDVVDAISYETVRSYLKKTISSRG
jgi:transposase